MKNLSIFILSISFFAATANAQTIKLPVNEPDNSKPLQFQDYPAKVLFNPGSLSNLFSAPLGSKAELKTGTDNALIAGQVVSITSKYENRIITIVIRSDNFPGSTITISKLTDEKGAVTYTGLILNRNKGDIYVLQQENGLFAMTKKKYTEVIAD